MNENEDFSDPEFYPYDDDEICDGCGGDGMNGQHCPLCCGAVYSPGTEECDGCIHSSECACN